MAKAIRVAAAMAVLLIGMSGLGTAQTTRTGNGVTILRGNTENPRLSGVGPGTGDPGTPAPGGGGSVDQSGAFNAVHTGSSSAGGEIANPPPGAGR